MFPLAQGNAEVCHFELLRYWSYFALKVFVADLCTPGQETTTENLHFSGPHFLQVSGPEKVAVNSTVKFTVQPTDFSGAPFHTSQYPYTTTRKIFLIFCSYKYMDFTAMSEVPYTYLEKTSNPGEFLFRSENPGFVDVLYSVSTTQATPPIRATKSRPVTVFPPFRVIPDTLSLLVGETADVTYKGGPYEDPVYRDGVRHLHHAASSSIATLERERTVRGKSLGNTSFRIFPQLKGQEKEFDIFAHLNVTVRQINGT